MKRKIIICIALFILPFSSFAQSVYFGAHIGTNIGWFSGDNWDDYMSASEQYYNISISQTPALLFNAGLFLEIMFTQNVGFVSEINYAPYGQDYNYSYLGTTFNGEFRGNSFEIPLLFRFAASSSKGIYAVLGPSIQFLIGEMELKESGSGISLSQSVEYDNQVILGLLGGIGYRIPIASNALNIEIRYERNITYAFDESKSPFDTNIIEVLIGFGFRIN